MFFFLNLWYSNNKKNYLRRPVIFPTALVLCENTTITHLNLRGCGIGANGMAELSTCLGTKANLQQLSLEDNQIDSKGLRNLGKLTEIFKRCNEVQTQ